MTITQTVEIPADRQSITLKVPCEIPAGKTTISFTPVRPSTENSGKSEERDIELFKLHAERLNKEALDVLSYQNAEI
ncbi:MAG: hypothetical protein FWC64_03950 [Treponema sp.]|nr:hypothetical protein [Treponema sp.]